MAVNAQSEAPLGIRPQIADDAVKALCIHWNLVYRDQTKDRWNSQRPEL
jgi:hypothetical protein